METPQSAEVDEYACVRQIDEREKNGVIALSLIIETVAQKEGIYWNRMKRKINYRQWKYESLFLSAKII